MVRLLKDHLILNRKTQRTRENARKYFKCPAEKSIERLQCKTEYIFWNENKTTSDTWQSLLMRRGKSRNLCLPSTQNGAQTLIKKKKASGFPGFTLSTWKLLPNAERIWKLRSTEDNYSNNKTPNQPNQRLHWPTSLYWQLEEERSVSIAKQKYYTLGSTVLLHTMFSIELKMRHKKVRKKSNRSLSVVTDKRSTNL